MSDLWWNSSESGWGVNLIHQNEIVFATFQGGNDCTYSGAYAQSGRMGSLSGAFSCTNGFSGTFSATEIEGSTSAFAARAALQSGACTWRGRIGGLRRGS